MNACVRLIVAFILLFVNYMIAKLAEACRTGHFQSVRFSRKCTHGHCKLWRVPVSLDGHCKSITCPAHQYSSPLLRTMKTWSFSALIDVSLCICSFALILLLKNHSYRVVSLGKPTKENFIARKIFTPHFPWKKAIKWKSNTTKNWQHHWKGQR